MVELKTDAELGLKLQEDHHRITEAEIKKDCTGLSEVVSRVDSQVVSQVV